MFDSCSMLKDRKRTVDEVKAFVDKRIAPTAAAKQFQELAKTIVDSGDDTRITAAIIENAAKAAAKGGAAGLAVPYSPPGRSTIMDVLAANPAFSVLVAAINAAGLSGALGEPGPLTLLAPTDDAFERALKQLGATREQLLARSDLPDILKHHVLPDKILARDMVDGGSALTLQGGSVTFDVGGNGVRISGAQVVAADVGADNGVVHVIDNVILPVS